MKFKILAFMLLILGGNAIAQVSPIKIGDKLPDNLISEMTGPQSTVNLSSFKGKLLILDFWATWCSPCVELMPKIDSLKKIFEGRVEFVPVTFEDRKTVTDFFKRQSVIKGFGLTSVINDQQLSQLFTHSSIPFYVWIDQQGKVIATTEATEITRQKIESAINGSNAPIVSISTHQSREVDIHKPMFDEQIAFLDGSKDSIVIKEPVKLGNILYRSVISKYIPDLISRMSWDSVHFSATNTPLINIYRLLFGLQHKGNPYVYWSKSRCTIEIKDTALAAKVNSIEVGAKYEHWLETNGYNYELLWQNSKSWPEKRKLLEEDVIAHFSRPFGLTANLEKRMAPADVLVISADSHLLKTNGGEPHETHDSFFYKQQNMPLSRFLGVLESNFWQFSERIVFDETKFAGKVDLELNCKMSDIGAVNKELEKYGLHFEDSNRLTDVLVIKEASKKE